ncbi:MAG TPA: hypothetical protein PK413_22150, partial [Thermoanaerobaculia bacterium]|nr:hypothetical protein [Thermoanaerobaculia bacterium]
MAGKGFFSSLGGAAEGTSLATVPRRVVAHRRELLADTLTPLAVYQRLEALSPHRFLFESVTGGESVSRFSLLGAGPREIYRLWPDCLERERDGRRESLPGLPLPALAELVAGFEAEPEDVPFTGGFVGFFGYDTLRLVEQLPGRPPDPFGLPLAWLGRFDSVVLFDHAYQRVLAIANEVEGESTAADAEARLGELEALLTGPGGSVEVVPADAALEADAAIGELVGEADAGTGKEIKAGAAGGDFAAGAEDADADLGEDRPR